MNQIDVTPPFQVLFGVGQSTFHIRHNGAGDYGCVGLLKMMPGIVSSHENTLGVQDFDSGFL